MDVMEDVSQCPGMGSWRFLHSLLVDTAKAVPRRTQLSISVRRGIWGAFHVACSVKHPMWRIESIFDTNGRNPSAPGGRWGNPHKSCRNVRHSRCSTQNCRSGITGSSPGHQHHAPSLGSGQPNSGPGSQSARNHEPFHPDKSGRCSSGHFP